MAPSFEENRLLGTARIVLALAALGILAACGGGTPITSGTPTPSPTLPPQVTNQFPDPDGIEPARRHYVRRRRPTLVHRVCKVEDGAADQQRQDSRGGHADEERRTQRHRIRPRTEPQPLVYRNQQRQGRANYGLRSALYRVHAPRFGGAAGRHRARLRRQHVGDRSGNQLDLAHRTDSSQAARPFYAIRAHRQRAAGSDHQRSRWCAVVHRARHQQHRAFTDSRAAAQRVQDTDPELRARRHRAGDGQRALVYRAEGQADRAHSDGRQHHRRISVERTHDARLFLQGIDGNFYFTDTVGNRMGQFLFGSHKTRLYKIPTANSGPTAMVLGPDEEIYLLETLGNKIAQFRYFNV